MRCSLKIITHRFFYLYWKFDGIKSLSLEKPCNGIEVGRVKNNKNPRLDELSGLVASRSYNSRSNFLLYSIEDSENENAVYAINIDGTLKGAHREIDFSINP